MRRIPAPTRNTMKSESTWARPIRSLFSTLIVSIAVVSSTAVHATAKEIKTSFKSIDVLGDSLSDTGRLYSVTGYPPPPYYLGRFSNGPLWVEYFAPRVGM